MRLFALVDGKVDRHDRPMMLGLPFDIAFSTPTKPMRLIGRFNINPRYSAVLNVQPKYDAVLNVQERYSFVAATDYGS